MPGWKQTSSPKALEPMTELPRAGANAGTHPQLDPSGMVTAVRAQSAEVPPPEEPWYTAWYIICAGQNAFVPPNHVYHSFSTFRQDTSVNSLRAPLHPCSSDCILADRAPARICWSEHSSSACTIEWIPASSGVQKRLHPAPRGAGIGSGAAPTLHPRLEGLA